VPESFFDLGQPDLAGQTQVFTFVTVAVLAYRELGHRRDSLPAGIAGPDTVLLHLPMVARREMRWIASEVLD
jgi:hypothetical protein